MRAHPARRAGWRGVVALEREALTQARELQAWALEELAFLRQ